MQNPEEIWNLLHDGRISDVRGAVPGDVTMRVEIDYLTSLMKPPCDAIAVTLLQREAFEYLRWADDLRSSDPRIVVDTEILSATATESGVRVICLNGQFDARYTGLALRRSEWHTGVLVGDR